MRVQVLFAQSSVLAGMKGLRSQHSRGDWEYELALDESAADTALLLQHMYGLLLSQPADFTRLKPGDTTSLARMAHKLGIAGITARVDALLSANCSSVFEYGDTYTAACDNVDIWLLADSYNLTDFRALCELHVARHFRSCITQKDVGQISGPSLARAAGLYMQMKENRF